MTKEELFTQLSEIRDKFQNETWNETVNLINQFIEENGHLHADETQFSPAERLSEDLILSGAWIMDRLRGYSGIHEAEGYVNSLTKKLRKALGYTY